ncbi:ER membrane protein complex subunit 1 [Psilocybe cubensis]|uniref:ER membrane protein complex subunit 1 n=2 Tax=Psilocybe cubensis TaxID=181762 RepID=A0ACB8GLK2_PSICU|nr:ER membrane protein complex subunit 1 [Psilocybe cubensis]KAH9476635.1 ER membrane protein complex subunit 1 [Psilocybe cubensis]
MRLLAAISPLITLSGLLQLSHLTQSVYALHESDVGVVDWHKHLIGVPHSNAPVTAPSFVDVDLDETETGTAIKANGTKTVIVTTTGNNVLAVLDPEDGAVLWRHIFDAEDRVAGYYKSSTTLATLSGPGGSTLRTFSLLTGSLLLEKRLHHPANGALLEPAHLGKQVVFSREGNDSNGNQKDVLYVLTNGCEVRKLDAQSGKEMWAWKSPDQGSLTIYSDILISPSSQHIHLIGLSSSTASFTLHTTALSISSGEVIENLSGGVPSSISDPLTQFFVVRASATSKDTGKPVILWLSKSTLYYLPLPSTSSSKQFKPRPQALKNSGSAGLEKLVDVGLGKEGHVVVGRSDGSSLVLRVAEQGEEEVVAESVWEFEGSATTPTQAESMYAGGLDARGAPAVGRVWWDHAVQKASADVYTVQSEASTQQAPRPFAFAFDTQSHGVLSHVALDGPRDASSTHARILITTTTGAVQLWSAPSSLELEPVLHWTREEGLAATVVAEFVELPEGGKGADIIARESEEGFLGRLSRQIVDAQGFPNYVANFIKRFTSSPAPAAATVVIDYRALSNAATPPSNDSTTTLARDAFGHRQLIITATLFGKVYAIDTSTGAMVWSRVLGMGWVGRAGMGGRVIPVKLFVIRAVGDEAVTSEGDAGDVKGDPEVVLVGQRRADNSLVDTVIFHINALTGEDALPSSKKSASDILAELGVESEGEGEEVEKEKEKEEKKDDQDNGGILEGQDIVAGPVVEVYILNAEGRKIIVLLDEFLQAYIYPSNPTAESVFARALPSLSFPLRAHVESRHRIVGHKLGLPPKDQSHFKPTAYPTWAISLPAGEEIQALLPQAPTMGHAKGSGVASVGKVLGSRKTLYKYLDERLFVVKTVARKNKVDEEGNAKTDVMCGIYVVDSAKGTIVYHAEVKASPPVPSSDAPGTPGAGAGTVRGGGCDIKTNLVENWLVYHYYEAEVAGGSVGGAKGYRMVSVEFYEGQKADDKIMSSSISAYSNDTLNYSVYEQAYVFPSAITALATTTTKFGITSKDLIVATANRKIQSFPRRIFDPRRPSRKMTAEDQEELLIQYDPLIPNDPKRALSHNYDVANVQKIITAPALLESTSLVFAYGLDMFLTRVTPSNTFDVLSESFNKVQLVLTVTGLLVAILVTRPMVKRKSLREKWYN